MFVVVDCVCFLCCDEMCVYVCEVGVYCLCGED